jgi:hypothetical protein
MKWIFTLGFLLLSASAEATEMKDSIDYALDRANNEKLEQEKDIDQINDEIINSLQDRQENDAEWDSDSRDKEVGK